MKTLQTMALAITLLALFPSCQSSSAQVKGLSNKETRNEIMGEIANDSTMSNEMIGAMMHSKNGMGMLQQHQMMTMGNQSSMMNMLKNNPGMMQSMLSAMMETAKGDSSMMSGMIKTMRGNPQMMQMMQNRMGDNMMNGMNHMHGMMH
ncbi:MAG: hypothetical protein ABI288_03970 [Ginsengibacter sp.]